MQRGAQENLWPKLFSRAPRCAPLRLRVLLHLLYQHHFRRKLLKTSRGRITGPCRNCQAAGKNYLCRCFRQAACRSLLKSGGDAIFFPVIGGGSFGGGSLGGPVGEVFRSV